MFICICNQVTDTQLREEIERGAETVRELKENLGVTNQCGKCGTCVKKCIKEHATSKSDFFPIAACSA
ncbi:MAG: (2Fe-2S)-binding protein [Pseudomonadota bacterium]